jgi:hypothetical protein
VIRWPVESWGLQDKGRDATSSRADAKIVLWIAAASSLLSNLAADSLAWLFLEIDVPYEGKRSGAGNAGDGRRCKIAGAFLLQVTPDLPNPAEYEADRHRDRDLENHHQWPSHGIVPFRVNATRLPSQG